MQQEKEESNFRTIKYSGQYLRERMYEKCMKNCKSLFPKGAR